MSTIEQYGAKSLDSEILIHSNLNEQTTRLYNKKLTVHHLCDYESSSHTSKCNRMKFIGPNGTAGQFSTDSYQNQQETIKTTSTITSSYFNTYDQSKKNYNDSSSHSCNESSKQSFPPFRIVL